MTGPRAACSPSRSPTRSRAASAAWRPGQFHRRGFHPTGLFAPFGITYLAGKLLGLDAEALARARRHLRQRGGGPARMLGGRHAVEVPALGLGRAERHHGRDAGRGGRDRAAAHLRRPLRALRVAPAGSGGRPATSAGSPTVWATRWESRNSSFKPYPAAHVLHPYVDAHPARPRAQHGITAADVVRIECPVAEFNVSIVCEPVAEKLAPASDSHGRVSLQYTLAEALYRGRLGKNAYGTTSLRHPEILALARRVAIPRGSDVPGPGPLQGRGSRHAGRRARDRRDRRNTTAARRRTR